MTDTNGNVLYGTEIMNLVPYKGRLYASTSCWEETTTTQLACQLLVLDSPTSTWRQLYKFAATNLRLTALRTVTFPTNNTGNAVAPVTMLLAATDKTTAGTVQAFSGRALCLAADDLATRGSAGRTNTRSAASCLAVDPIASY